MWCVVDISTPKFTWRWFETATMMVIIYGKLLRLCRLRPNKDESFPQGDFSLTVTTTEKAYNDGCETQIMTVVRSLLGKVCLYVSWFPQRVCDICYKLSSALHITIVKLNNRCDIICFITLDISTYNNG